MIQNIRLKTKISESIEKQKTSFSKVIMENADLYKPVSNKIMTTQEKYIKCDFVTPLIVHSPLNYLSLVKELIQK